jgi:hypothetical protein
MTTSLEDIEEAFRPVLALALPSDDIKAIMELQQKILSARKSRFGQLSCTSVGGDYWEFYLRTPRDKYIARFQNITSKFLPYLLNGETYPANGEAEKQEIIDLFNNI